MGIGILAGVGVYFYWFTIKETVDVKDPNTNEVTKVEKRVGKKTNP
jgi:hypothetical protein